MRNRDSSIRANHFLLATTMLFGALLGTYGIARAGTPGIDGPKTISAANTVVNAYDYLISGTAGSRTITVNNANNLTLPGGSAVGPGSVLLLYQANGATIDDSDDTGVATQPMYGTVTNGANAGYYEFITVGSVSGNTITISSACNALLHTYSTSGATGSSEAEVVRVPQYSSLAINAGASITAPAWSATENTVSGSTTYGSPISIGGYGGIVAINVAGTTTINGSINVTGDGFLGGDGYQDAGASSPVAPANHAQPITDTVFSGETGGDLQSALGGMKGESIAGNQATLDANFISRYGRGSPANGGGGGNGHNNGGGGGANGNNGNTWYGVGLLDTNYTNYYSNANGQNPLGMYDSGGFSANGTALNGTPMSVDSGGGRGGYSFAAPSAGVTPSYSEGGFGGRPLGAAANSRIFFGGGGGAGDENDGSGGYGGNGGGIVIINTGVLAGSGSIVANGSPGGVPNSSDGAGGGGGGGSVVVLAGSGLIATINANGGAGGGMLNGGGNDDEGTGGGGGGGFVAAPATTISVAGGVEGFIDTRAPAAAFQPYGATLGATGGTAAAPTSFTYCFTPVIGAAKAGAVVNNGDGTYNITYTVVLENYGDTPLTSVAAQDVLANTFTSVMYSIVTEPTTPIVTGGATATAVANYDGTAATNVVTGTLPIGATITTTFTVKIRPPAGSQTYNNTATTSALGTTGNANNVSTTDSSQNGLNPDPAGSGNPAAENVVTPVTIVGQPVLLKNVQNVSTGEATGLMNDTAIPGNILKYTLSFTNNTGGLLSGYSIKDPIPTNTTYYATVPAACASYPAGMTCTAVYTPPVGNTAGYVTFTLSGTATGQTSPGVPSTTTTSPAQLIFTFEVTVN